MTDKTYEVLIDKQPFKAKPTPQQIPSINSRIASQSVKVTQQELATLVGENRSNNRSCHYGWQTSKRKYDSTASCGFRL